MRFGARGPSLGAVLLLVIAVIALLSGGGDELGDRGGGRDEVAREGKRDGPSAHGRGPARSGGPGRKVATGGDRGVHSELSVAQRLHEDAVATRVERVVDGDTVVLEGLGSSRLIGVDTPESVAPGQPVECFGKRASRFTEDLLRPGTRVHVRRGAEPTDRYGRALVYLWLSDGRLLNALLARRGLAKPLTIPPNDDLAALFERLAIRAGRIGRGLWGACRP